MIFKNNNPKAATAAAPPPLLALIALILSNLGHLTKAATTYLNVALFLQGKLCLWKSYHLVPNVYTYSGWTLPIRGFGHTPLTCTFFKVVLWHYFAPRCLKQVYVHFEWSFNLSKKKVKRKSQILESKSSVGNFLLILKLTFQKCYRPSNLLFPYFLSYLSFLQFLHFLFQPSFIRYS